MVCKRCWWYEVTDRILFALPARVPLHAELSWGGGSVMLAEVYVHCQRVGLTKRQGWAKAAREKFNAIIEDAHFASPAEPAEGAA